MNKTEFSRIQLLKQGNHYPSPSSVSRWTPTDAASAVDVVAPFEKAHQTAVAVGGRGSLHEFRQRGEIFRLQTQRADRVVLVGVETGADQDQFRPAALDGGVQFRLEPFEIILPRSAECHGKIDRRPQSTGGSGFVVGPRSRIKRKPVSREEPHVIPVVEHVLRAVAVVHVPIDDQHPLQIVGFGGRARRRGRCC